MENNKTQIIEFNNFDFNLTTQLDLIKNKMEIQNNSIFERYFEFLKKSSGNTNFIKMFLISYIFEDYIFCNDIITDWLEIPNYNLSKYVKEALLETITAPTSQKIIMYDRENLVRIRNNGKKIWYCDKQTFFKIIIEYNNANSKLLRNYLIDQDKYLMKFLKEDNIETKRLSFELLNKKDELLNKKDEEIKLLNTKIQHSGMIYKIYEKDKTNLLYVGKSDNFGETRINQHFEERLKLIQGFQKIDAKLALIDINDIIIEKEEFKYFDKKSLKDEETRQIVLFHPRFNIDKINSSYTTKCSKIMVRRTCYEKHLKACKKCLKITNMH